MSMRKKAILPSAGRAALFFCLLPALACPARAAQDGAAARQKALEQKAGEAVSAVLGPGKARVIVRIAPGAETLARELDVPARDGHLTVLVYLTDAATDDEAQKVRGAVSRQLGLADWRGDEVLLVRPWSDGGAGGRSWTSGYLRPGLFLLAGMLIGFVLHRAKAAAAVKVTAAVRAAPVVPPADYARPAAPPPAPPDDDELNIPSRSGFYKH